MRLTQHSQLKAIPSGQPGVEVTLKIMADLCETYRKDIAVRETALRVVRRCDQKDYAAEVAAIHAYVRDDVSYRGDVRDVETLQSPDYTLRMQAGDCDDKSLLVACLLESIGYKTRFVAIGTEPGIYSHVYAQVFAGNKWVSLETTEPVSVGWSVPASEVKIQFVQHVGETGGAVPLVPVPLFWGVVLFALVYWRKRL